MERYLTDHPATIGIGFGGLMLAGLLTTGIISAVLGAIIGAGIGFFVDRKR